MKSNGVDFEHTGSGQKAGELTPDVIKGRVPTATWAGATVGEHKTVSRSRRVQTVQLTGSLSYAKARLQNIRFRMFKS